MPSSRGIGELFLRSLNNLIVDLQALPYARAGLLCGLFGQTRTISKRMTSQILGWRVRAQEMSSEELEAEATL